MSPIASGSRLSTSSPPGGTWCASPEPLRLVEAASDAGMEATPLAHLYVSDAGAALRTLLGAKHSHFIGVYPSIKTGLSNPYEGVGEQALAVESEVRHDVLDYQTQPFRLRMLLGGKRLEWICDHIRQLACGTVEAIEVKVDPDDLDDEYIMKMQMARDLLGRLGWRFRVRYEAEIVGPAERQVNKALIAAHRSFGLSDEQRAAFEALRARQVATTFGAVRAALGAGHGGTAAAHRLMVAGRIAFDLDLLLEDVSPVRLLPPPRFNSRIRL